MAKGFKCGTGFNESSFNAELNDKLSMKKLWENASPTSSFAAQTISLDLSKYDEVLVRFRTYKSQTAVISSQGGIGEDVIANYIWGDTGNYSHRWAKIKSDGVQFYDSSYNKETNNESCIPWQIYGIKGVSE